MSGRGGRGGGRGGRGGGGAGGGFGDKPRGGPEGISTGTLTQTELSGVMKGDGAEKMYPEYKFKTLKDTDTFESRVAIYSTEIAKRLRYSPYRLTGTDAATEKKDFATYGERSSSKTNVSALGLNAEQLGMDKDFFPKGIWELYFDKKDPEGDRIQRLKAGKKKAKKGKLDEMDDAEVKEDYSDDDDVEMEDQLSEEEDYGEDDYGNNYFSGGEGDDMDDDGGGGGDDI